MQSIACFGRGPARLLHVSDLHFGTQRGAGRRGEPRAADRARRPGARDRERRPDPPRPRRTSTTGRRASCARSGGRCSRSPATTTSRTRSRRASRGTFARVRAASGRRPSPSTAATALARRRAQLGPRRGGTSRAALRDEQLGAPSEHAGRRRRTGALRVVALHHHLIGAPWRSRKKPVARRNHVLARARRRRRGADPRRAHPPGARSASGASSRSSTGDVRGVVVSIAPGLGQPRPHRRGEARGLHVYEVDERHARGRDVHLARRRLGR